MNFIIEEILNLENTVEMMDKYDEESRYKYHEIMNKEDKTDEEQEELVYITYDFSKDRAKTDKELTLAVARSFIVEYNQIPEKERTNHPELKEKVTKIIECLKNIDERQNYRDSIIYLQTLQESRIRYLKDIYKK
jgi:hypothetical protein